MVQRVAAGIAFVTAVALFGLGMLLASIDRGNGASPALLALTGTIAEVGMAIVLLYAFSTVPDGGWAWAGRIASVVAMGILFAGDATQTDALHPPGNAVFYTALILLGSLMWRSHRWLGGFAIFNGLLGFAFLAFAASLEVPEDLNLLVIVVWLLAIGIDWLRVPVRHATITTKSHSTQVT